MKKLLAILGSLTLITSSSSAVIACTNSQASPDPSATNYFNNNLNNLMGAGFQKAKAVILDDQFGIAQVKTLASLGGMLASENIPDYQPKDGALTKDSVLKDVIGKYFGFNPVSPRVVDGKNITLGHTNGVESSIEALIPAKLKPIAQQVISWIKSLNLVGEPFMNFSSLNHTLNSTIEFFKANGEVINKIIDQILKVIKDKLNIDVKGQLKVWLPQIINGIDFVMSVGPVEKLRQALPTLVPTYQQLIDAAFDDLGAADLTFKDVNKKLFSLVVEIIEQIVDVTPDEGLAPLDPELSDEEKFLITLINNLIKGEAIKTKDLSQTPAILGLLKSVFELMILNNIYFQEFDFLKSYQVVDKEHLFSPTKDNYTFLSELKDLKVSDSVVYQDHALNINYFMANLDYFFGSLRNFDQQAEYRFQQLLFLLFNDPSTPSRSTNSYYLDKDSILLTHLLNIGLGLGFLNEIAADQILVIMKQPTTKENVLNLLKPVILGFVNGDDATALVKFIDNFLPILEKLVPELTQFPWNQVMAIVKQMVKNLGASQENTQNLFHFFMLGNGKILFKDVQLPAQADHVVSLLFGGGDKNLFSFLNKPLYQIFTLLGEVGIVVPGFENGVINAFGDNFTLKSVPELIGLLTNYLNHLDPKSRSNTNEYLVADQPIKSLQVLNLDMQPIANLLKNLLGTEADQNLFSQFLIKLLSITADGEITLNVPDALEFLGFFGNDTYEQDSFLGALAQTTLPILNQKIKENPEIIVDGQFKLDQPAYFEVDLFQLWAHDGLDVFNKLTTPADYSTLINSLLSNQQAYELVYDPNQIYYFSSTQRTLIKSFKYQVIFKNPINDKKTTYWFEVSRNSNAEVFHFDSIINDKILGES